MKKSIIFTIVILSFNLLIKAQPSIKADLGILFISEGKYYIGVGEQVAFVGDGVRLFVRAGSSKLNCYVISIDETMANMLDTRTMIQGNLLMLPSSLGLYTFDGNSKIEKFAVICSESKIDEIEKLFKSGSSVPASLWETIQREILNRTQVAINTENNPTIKSGGPTRALGRDKITNSDFESSLISYSGSYVIKTYEFRIK